MPIADVGRVRFDLGDPPFRSLKSAAKHSVSSLSTTHTFQADPPLEWQRQDRSKDQGARGNRSPDSQAFQHGLEFCNATLSRFRQSLLVRYSRRAYRCTKPTTGPTHLPVKRGYEGCAFIVEARMIVIVACELIVDIKWASPDFPDVLPSPLSAAASRIEPG